MQIQRFNLRETPTEYGFMPYMEVYLIDAFRDTRRPAVVVFPGGAYNFVCADREGERVAINYNAAGYHAAVVHYSVGDHRAPEQLLEAAEAIRIMRAHADEWQLDKDKIAVCGFSAGGHLAASIATLWNESSVFCEEDIASRVCRPNASVLCYPVITSNPNFIEKGSFSHLLGDSPTAELLMMYSLERQVDSHTPPAFLWHTCEDNCVPMENSMLYASALRAHDILCELHIYPKGWHGMTLVADETIWSKPMFSRDYAWMRLSIDFLNELFGII